MTDSSARQPTILLEDGDSRDANVNLCNWPVSTDADSSGMHLLPGLRE